MKLRDIVKQIAFKSHTTGDLLATPNNGYWYQLLQKTSDGFFNVVGVEKFTGKTIHSQHIQYDINPSIFRAIKREWMV